MNKTLTVRQFAAVKRVAMNVNPLVVKKNKLMDKICELRKEVESLNGEIMGHEMGIQVLTGGLVSEDLLTKKVEVTDKVDKNGHPIKIIKYEPSEIVTFNEELKVYEIKEDSVEDSVESNDEAGNIEQNCAEE